jgi:hypothetical protein
VKDVSTFPDLGTAQKAIQAAINAEQERIGRWLKAGELDFLDPPIQMDTGGDVGSVLTRSGWVGWGGTQTHD